MVYRLVAIPVLLSVTVKAPRRLERGGACRWRATRKHRRALSGCAARVRVS